MKLNNNSKIICIYLFLLSISTSVEYQTTPNILNLIRAIEKENAQGRYILSQIKKILSDSMNKITKYMS